MKNLVTSLLLVGVSVLFAACSTTPTSEGDKQELSAETNGTIADFKAADTSMSDALNKAYGYAVFPKVGKGGAVVGGAWGRGQVFEQGKLIGYSELSQGSVGAQLGGQVYKEVILFQNKAALDRFTRGEFAFAAQASAVALKAGAGANAKYNDGVAVFTLGEKGLMYEASVGGQKFDFERL